MEFKPYEYVPPAPDQTQRETYKAAIEVLKRAFDDPFEGPDETGVREPRKPILPNMAGAVELEIPVG